MAQWMVSVRNSHKQKNILINAQPGETDVDVFERAKKEYMIVKQKYPQYTVELISRKKAFAPKQKTKRGYLYCPFCRTDRLFQADVNTGYSHCPICGISDREYYVRKYNRLWNKN